MQKMFKVLASVAAWVLFLLALVGLVWTFIAGWGESTSEVISWFSLWVATLVLSVVVMKLGKMLD